MRDIVVLIGPTTSCAYETLNQALDALSGWPKGTIIKVIHTERTRGS